MSHGLRLRFRIHQDAMPFVQNDRGMIGVTDPFLTQTDGFRCFTTESWGYGPRLDF